MGVAHANATLQGASTRGGGMGAASTVFVIHSCEVPMLYVERHNASSVCRKASVNRLCGDAQSSDLDV